MRELIVANLLAHIVSFVFCLPTIKSKFSFVVAFLSLSIIILSSAHAGTTVIQAEAYNNGGEGVAYHDTDPENYGNAGIRTDEGVDLLRSGDGTIRIGFVRSGEWVTYDYDFPVTGTYKFDFYLSTPERGTTVRVTIGDNEAQTLNIPSTGSWDNFKRIPLSMQVEAGEKTILIEMPNNSFDMDRFIITTPETAPSPIFYATYAANQDKRFEVSWDAVAGATYYEVRMYNFERKTFAVRPRRVTDTKWESGFPDSGHFIPSVRACNEEECTEWSASNNAKVATVNKKPKAWWLYGYTAPSGPINN